MNIVNIRNFRFFFGRSHYLMSRSVASISSPTEFGIVHSPAETLEFPTGNLAIHLLQCASKWKNFTAIQCGITDKKTSYSQLIDQTHRWSGFLSQCGIKQGDIVTTITENCPQFCPLFMGTIGIGAILSPINSRLTAEYYIHEYNLIDVIDHIVITTGEISKLLKNTKSTFLVVDEASEMVVKDAIKENEKDMRLFCIGQSKYNLPNIDDILNNKEILFVDPVPLSGEEIMFIPFSSGTTGNPKAVALSHNSFLINIFQFLNKYHNLFPYTPADGRLESFLAVLPFFHISGSLLVLSVGFTIGAKLITLPKFDPQLFLSSIINSKLYTLHTVPTMVNFLNSRPECNSKSMSNLELIMCGAAPVLPSMVNKLKEKLHGNTNLSFCEGYGMTESMITHTTPSFSNRYGTTGQLLSNISAKVIDTVTGEILGPDQEGEICLRTPSRMKGYYDNPEATSQILKDDWIYSGDIGYYDKDGFFYIIGRTKDLIKVKGLQVSPTEIEEVLQSHPSVIESSVIGIPDDRFGEVPKAFVIAEDSISSVELQKYVSDRLSKHKHLLGGIIFVDSFPKTETGKILKKELRKW